MNNSAAIFAFVTIFALVRTVCGCGCDGVPATDLAKKSQHADCYYNSEYARNNPPSDTQNVRNYYWIQRVHEFAV